MHTIKFACLLRACQTNRVQIVPHHEAQDVNKASTLRCGVVERAGRFLGLTGWALDPARPGMPLEIEVLAGEVVVASWRTGLPRPDLGLGEAAAAAGFRIPRSALQTLPAWQRRRSATPLVLRIAGS